MYVMWKKTHRKIEKTRRQTIREEKVRQQTNKM